MAFWDDIVKSVSGIVRSAQQSAPAKPAQAPQPQKRPGANIPQWGVINPSGSQAWQPTRQGQTPWDPSANRQRAASGAQVNPQSSDQEQSSGVFDLWGPNLPSGINAPIPASTKGALRFSRDQAGQKVEPDLRFERSQTSETAKLRPDFLRAEGPRARANPEPQRAMGEDPDMGARFIPESKIRPSAETLAARREALTRLTPTLETIDDKRYKSLDDSGRAAADFNALLERAILADKALKETPLDSFDRKAYDATYARIFGDTPEKKATIAPHTVGLLNTLGVSELESSLDQFLDGSGYVTLEDLEEARATRADPKERGYRASVTNRLVEGNLGLAELIRGGRYVDDSDEEHKLSYGGSMSDTQRDDLVKSMAQSLNSDGAIPQLRLRGSGDRYGTRYSGVDVAALLPGGRPNTLEGLLGGVDSQATPDMTPEEIMSNPVGFFQGMNPQLRTSYEEWFQTATNPPLNLDGSQSAAWTFEQLTDPDFLRQNGMLGGKTAQGQDIIREGDLEHWLKFMYAKKAQQSFGLS